MRRRRSRAAPMARRGFNRRGARLEWFKRMLLGAVAAMVVVAVLAVGSASATTPPRCFRRARCPRGIRTQDANAPYLAWRGEHVRLVGCDGLWFPSGRRRAGCSRSVNDPVSNLAGLRLDKVGQCSRRSGIAESRHRVHQAEHTDAGRKRISEKQFIVGWMPLSSRRVGGGDVNAGDFCNKPKSTRSPGSIRLLGPYSNCWHDPLDPRHDQDPVKGNCPSRRLQKWGLGVT